MKVSDSEIHDGETLTLGGGAGLQPGERSDLLASDLVFRFELVDESRAVSLGVNTDTLNEGVAAGAVGATDASGAAQVPMAPPAAVNPPPALHSPTQEGEGKEGDDDDVSMLGAGLSSGVSRKRRTSGGGADNKRRKLGGSLISGSAFGVEANVVAGTKSSSSSSGGGVSSAPGSTSSDHGPAKSTSSNPRDVEAPSQNQRLSSLKDEVKCAICYDYFFNACTLQCSHSFCQPCIEEWLHKKHECPVCRSAVESKPNRSNQLDNMVQLVMDDSERLGFEQRKRRHTDKMNRQHQGLESLRKRLEDASANKETFLNIADEWTQGQKATFEQGVNQYRGTARQQYCDATGLTRDFVETAPLAALVKAAINVGLIHTSGEDEDHANLRKRMHMFIHYG